MTSHANHPFHSVEQSPWLLTGAIGALITMSSMIKWFHQYNQELLLTGGLIMILTMIQWRRDITREGTYQGLHTKMVTKALRWVMILLIISEVFFFISFFWAFFHSSLSPTIELGSTGPPTGILPFNPLQIPLLNTAILLASGVTVIALLLPMTIVLTSSNMSSWMMISSVFLLILIIGLYHEWSQGSFQWAT